MVALLLEAGADVQAVGNHAEEYVRIYSPLDGVTPLHEAAASNSNPAVVTALVQAGAAVDTGRPPDAAPVPIEHAGTFLTVNAIRNVRDPGQTSPLHLAALRNRNPAMVEALVALGADLELRDRDGRTALHVAARSNPSAFMALLAASNPDPEVAAVLLDATRTSAPPRGHGAGPRCTWPRGTGIPRLPGSCWKPVPT